MPLPHRTADQQVALTADVHALRWYHSIDLGHGLVTPGVDNTPLRLGRLQLPESFAGQTVLDIGAWDGFFSFEAERRGAARVVSSDHFAWHGPGWGTGRGKAGFDLARQALGSAVEDIAIDVLELSPERIGQFDVVFFLGVLYHVPNPLLALERVASVCRKMLILETVVDMIGISRPAVAFYPSGELSHDPTNWWAPNEAAMHGLLTATGFSRVRTMTPLPKAPYRAARALVHAVRGQNDFNSAFRQDRAVFHAFK